MGENELLSRITVNPRIFEGKSIIRGRCLAVKHVSGMSAAGDMTGTLLAYSVWLERVREVCRHDRSIAIAHGLEELCEAPVRAVKAKGGQQAEAETAEMAFEEEEE